MGLPYKMGRTRCNLPKDKAQVVLFDQNSTTDWDDQEEF